MTFDETMRSLAKLGLLPMLVILSVGFVHAQTNIGKSILEKLTARIEKLEKSCVKDIRK